MQMLSRYNVYYMHQLSLACSDNDTCLLALHKQKIYYGASLKEHEWNTNTISNCFFIISFSFIKNKQKKKKEMCHHWHVSLPLIIWSAPLHTEWQDTQKLTQKVWREDKAKVEKEPSACFWHNILVQGLQNLCVKHNL